MIEITTLQFLAILGYVYLSVLLLVLLLFIMSSKFRLVCHVLTIVSLFLSVMMAFFPSIEETFVRDFLIYERGFFLWFWPHPSIWVAVWIGYLIYDIRRIKNKK